MQNANDWGVISLIASGGASNGNDYKYSAIRENPAQILNLDVSAAGVVFIRGGVPGDAGNIMVVTAQVDDTGIGKEQTPAILVTLSMVYLPGNIPASPALELDWVDLRSQVTTALAGFVPVEIEYTEGEDSGAGMVVAGSLTAKGGYGNLRITQVRHSGNLAVQLLNDNLVRLEYTCLRKIGIIIFRVQDDTPGGEKYKDFRVGFTTRNGCVPAPVSVPPHGDLSRILGRE